MVAHAFKFSTLKAEAGRSSSRTVSKATQKNKALKNQKSNPPKSNILTNKQKSLTKNPAVKDIEQSTLLPV